VDSPVGIVPVTRVDAAKDALTLEWERDGPNGTPFLFEAVYKGKKPSYNAKDMEGLPIGVQIVGKNWEDEKVIGMMKVVDDALGPRDFGPGSWHSAK
jgi:Asp-tRNA(Asn)/Glu-tRNA(Gln) amidotransferase A subunit family amidase